MEKKIKEKMATEKKPVEKTRKKKVSAEKTAEEKRAEQRDLYKSLVLPIYQKQSTPMMRKRIMEVIQQYDRSFFLNTTHRKQFLAFCEKKGLDLLDVHTKTKLDSRYIATGFVLAAIRTIDTVDYVKHIRYPEVCFNIIRRTHVTADEYALFKIAKDIFYDLEDVSMEELADYFLIGDGAFKVWINANVLLDNGVGILTREERG